MLLFLLCNLDFDDGYLNTNPAYPMWSGFQYYRVSMGKDKVRKHYHAFAPRIATHTLRSLLRHPPKYDSWHVS